MILKKNFALRQIADEWIVLPLASETVDFTGMLNLNESGAMLWKVLEQDCSKEALVRALLEEYEVSEEQAATDAEEFLNKLIEAGCIEA